MDFSQIDLLRPMRQQNFAALLGISPQAVSGWVKDGRLRRGDSALVWLRTHVARLREQAAKRDDDHPLVAARTALAHEQAIAQALKNATMRREWAPVEVLDAVIGAIARQLQADLATLIPAIERAYPELPPAARQIIEAQVVKAVARADGLSVAAAPAADPDDEE